MSMPQTVHPPQCVTVDSGGQKILNGGFETNGGAGTNSFANWIVTGSWIVGIASYGVGSMPNSGTYFAYGGNQPTNPNSLTQTLTRPVVVSTITALGFYMSYYPQYSDSLNVILSYSDGSQTSHDFNYQPTGYKDLTPYLSPGKLLTRIQFSDDAATNAEMAVDDVSLLGKFAGGTSPRLFYNPQST